MNYLATIKENAHGHKKKLLFFIERIENLRREKGLKRFEIRILDVGCGNGRAITLPLGELGYSMTGVDFHKPSIEHARTINDLENVAFLNGSLKDLPKENNYNVIIFSDILEHLHNPEHMLKDSRSYLCDAGIVLISIPNGFGPFEIENFIFRLKPFKFIIDVFHSAIKIIKNRRGKNNIPYNSECGHVKFFSLRKIKRIISLAGYKINKFKKSVFLGGHLTLLVISVFRPLIWLNVIIGEYLPYFMCSVWYFECKVASDE